VATILQHRHMTTTTRTAYTPAVGEEIYDTDQKATYIGDGTTAGGTPVAGQFARTAASPSAPSGTTSTTGLMMGLAVAITPLVSGNLEIKLVGSIANATATDGAKAQLRYGTGTAPANGAALTGTTSGSLVEATQLLAAQKVPFALLGYVSGLTLGTAYWVDVGLAAITGGTATITDLYIFVEEKP
jgi:hypothetical protein